MTALAKKYDSPVRVGKGKYREREYPDQYVGGMHTKKERPFFQALYDEVGYDAAVQLMPEIVKLVRGMPPAHILQEWCYEVDFGKAEIPDAVKTTIGRRLNRLVRSRHRMATLSALDALKKLCEKFGDTPDFKLGTSINYLFSGANTAMLAGGYGGKPQQQDIRVGNLIIDAGAPPPRRVRAPRMQQIVEAQFKELASGGSE